MKLLTKVISIAALLAAGVASSAQAEESQCLMIHVPQADPVAFKQAINIANNIPKQLGADAVRGGHFRRIYHFGGDSYHHRCLHAVHRGVCLPGYRHSTDPADYEQGDCAVLFVSGVCGLRGGRILWLFSGVSFFWLTPCSLQK